MNRPYTRLERWIFGSYQHVGIRLPILAWGKRQEICIWFQNIGIQPRFQSADSQGKKIFLSREGERLQKGDAGRGLSTRVNADADFHLPEGKAELAGGVQGVPLDSVFQQLDEGFIGTGIEKDFL